MFSEALRNQAAEILAAARAQSLRIATAESCTGGLLAGLLTEIPGSSDVFERGFVTYSNEAKFDLLGVPEHIIEEFGAVSEQVARAMARGALVCSRAELSVAVTGIAGPGGGSAAKPVGLVFVAVGRSGAPIEIVTREFHFDNIGRSQVRLSTIAEALNLLRALV